MAGLVFLERPQGACRSTRHRRRRPSAAEVAGAAASHNYPVFDLYLLARLSVQEAADGERLDDQVCQGKRDAAELLGIEQDRIAFVDAGLVASGLPGAIWTHLGAASQFGYRGGVEGWKCSLLAALSHKRVQ